MPCHPTRARSVHPASARVQRLPELRHNVPASPGTFLWHTTRPCWYRPAPASVLSLPAPRCSESCLKVAGYTLTRIAPVFSALRLPSSLLLSLHFMLTSILHIVEDAR